MRVLGMFGGWIIVKKIILNYKFDFFVEKSSTSFWKSKTLSKESGTQS